MGIFSYNPINFYNAHNKKRQGRFAKKICTNGENAMLKNSNEIYKNLPTEITYGNYTAPLWQEAFDFFETQFGIHVTFVPRSWDANKIKWSFWGNCIIDGNHFFNLDLGDGDRQDDSYDFIFEAKLEAIKLLIDYVKSEQYQNISKTKGKAW